MTTPNSGTTAGTARRATHLEPEERPMSTRNIAIIALVIAVIVLVILLA